MGSKHKYNIFLSSDSLEITGSEFYPSYHGGIIPDHKPVNHPQQQGSSSISTSSTNQTVLERPGYQSGSVTRDKQRQTELNGNIHVEPEEVHIQSQTNDPHRENENSCGKEKGKHSSSSVNNNTRSNNFKTVPDRDAYRPRLYRCCSSSDGHVTSNGNDAPEPRDHNVIESHDMTSQHQHIHRARGTKQQVQNKSNRSSFLDNCQVVGVL